MVLIISFVNNNIYMDYLWPHRLGVDIKLVKKGEQIGSQELSSRIS